MCSDGFLGLFFNSLLCFCFWVFGVRLFYFAVYIMNYCRVNNVGFVKHMLNCRVEHREVVKYM